MSQAKKTFLLVDGTALAYQSFFALQNLKSPEGRPTGAVYGFYEAIRRLREEYEPDYLAIALDRGSPVERMAAFEDYKADRPPPPTDLIEQLPLIEELMTVLGIGVLAIEGVEADDVLGTLATSVSSEDVEVYIFSPDKDMLQVVDDHIKVIRRHGSNTRVYDRAGVQERYGCPPERFIDLLGLMGDKVDNIPGVPGVGEKTAASLLGEFGSLEEVLEQAETVKKPKLRQNLLDYAEQAVLSKELATLKLDVALETTVEDLVPAEPDWAKAKDLFSQLGFRRAAEEALSHLGAEAAQGEPSTNGKVKTDYRLTDTVGDLKKLVQTLSKEKAFGLDTETTSVNPHRAELVGICLGATGGRGWYLSIGHQGARNLSLKKVQEGLGPLLADPNVGKIGHHLKYDARILERHGLPVEGWIGDTMLLAHLLHTQLESLKLDALAKVYLDRPMTEIAELIGEKKSEQITMDFVDVEKAARYGAEDAEVTLALHETLDEELSDESVRSWYFEVEIPLALALLEMETKGVKVDPKILARQSKQVGEFIEVSRAELFEIAGKEFNPNSPKQLATLLFDERGVPANKSRSTRQQVLEELAAQGEPLAEKIIEYRKYTKLKNTYLDALPELIDERDGRVHTSYRSTIANTGRISSDSPNLQNIPIRTDLGRRIREAFVAEEGYVFVAADYSQIELRVLAHFAQDPGFMKAFEQGLDIHSFTASEIFEVDMDSVDKEMRRKAKEINFGLNYGMSSFGLASRLGISRTEARRYMDRYFSRYAKIKDYFDRTLEEAEKNGYVGTLVGRRIEIPRPRSRTGREARAAINAPIQGSAADILKKAMLLVRNELREREMESVMVLTVHDEIILEVPEKELGDVKELLPRLMVGAFELSVPIEVDLSAGKSWADLG